MLSARSFVKDDKQTLIKQQMSYGRKALAIRRNLNQDDADNKVTYTAKFFFTQGYYWGLGRNLFSGHLVGNCTGTVWEVWYPNSLLCSGNQSGSHTRFTRLPLVLLLGTSILKTTCPTDMLFVF